MRYKELVPRLSVEFAVVVLGVLVALWVDSVVDARGELEARDFLLSSLLTEISGNIDALEEATAEGAGVVASMRLLLSVHDGTVARPSADSLELLIRDATTYWRASRLGLAFGIYDAMVATGTARLLPTRELAQGLARHRFALVSGQGDESYAERAFENVVRVIRNHGGWYAFMPADVHERIGIPARPRSRDEGALLNDPEFGDALFARILYEDNIMVFYQEQLEELEVTRELLARQLGP